MTIPFPEGAKSFAGDFGIYQWARGGTGAACRGLGADGARSMGAPADRGRSVLPDEVLHDVLGPSGSSVGIRMRCRRSCDVALAALKDAAWPMLAVPELLQYDHMRFTQDQSGMGRFFTPEREPRHWPVKTADLLARPSRRRELIDKAGDYAIYGPAELHAKLRDALMQARDRVAQSTIGTMATAFSDCVRRPNGRYA